MTDYPGTHWGEAPCASNYNLLSETDKHIKKLPDPKTFRGLVIL